MRYFLELCLQSVQAAIADLEAEIIVVDNHSSDDSCLMVTQLFPEVILIENEANFGFSKGNNIGVDQAKGEYLCILNPDTVVAEDTFVKLLNYADSHPEMGILGCKLIDGLGQFLPESKRNMPTPMVALKKIMGFSNSYYANHLSPTQSGQVEILVGAFMCLKRKRYQEIGGFDEDYFMYGEDIDLSYRVLKAGYQNHYYGKTAVIHYKGESTLKDKVYAKRFYGAMKIFYDKHFKSNTALDVTVRLAIFFTRFLVKVPSAKSREVSSHMVMSQNAEFKTQLPFPTTTMNSFVEVANGTQVIFDAKTTSFKAIIEFMMAVQKTEGVTFRIAPRNSHYIIGSDSPREPGEVVLLQGF